MYKFGFLFVVCALYPSSCCAKQNFIATALVEVGNYFVSNSMQFDFVISSNESSLADVLDETMKRGMSENPERIIKTTKNETFNQTQSAIFMFDSFSEYWNFDRNLRKYTNFGPVRINNLVYCTNSSSKEIEEVARKYQKDHEPNFLHTRDRGCSQELHMTSFLIDDKNEIVLKTLSLFTPQLCGSLQLVELNKYSKRSSKWMSDKMFTPEVSHYHGCQLNFGVPSHHLPDTHYKEPDGKDPAKIDVFQYVEQDGTFVSLPAGDRFYLDSFQTNNDNLTYAIDGYLTKMVEALAVNLNYSCSFNPIDSVHVMVQKSSRIDYIIVSDVCDTSVFLHGFTTTPTSYGFYSLIVPPGEPYSSLEKLFLPFDFHVWILFMIVFIVAFGVILLLRIFADPKVAEFMIGENVRNPTLNIFLIFMGGGMKVLPKKNFPRFLIMSFILYCLIMRTAYQGKYFEFLTSDVRKREVQSVDELIDKNFVIYSKRQYAPGENSFDITKYVKNIDMFVGTEINRGIPRVDGLRGGIDHKIWNDRLIYNITNATFKGSLIEESFELLTMNENHNGTLRWKFMDMKIFSFYKTLVFPRFHHLYSTFNEKVLQLTEGGFFNHWLKRWTKSRYNVEKPPPPALVVLSLDDLGIGFLIWLIMLLFCFIVFVLELLSYLGRVRRV